MIEHIGVWKSLHYPVKGIEVYSLVMPPKNWVQKKGLDIPSFFCWAIEQRIPELNRSQLIGPIWNPPPVEHLSDPHGCPLPVESQTPDHILELPSKPTTFIMP